MVPLTFLAILSTFLRANEIPSDWDQTITANGIPAYKDMRSEKYVPEVIRNMELNSIPTTGLQKRRRVTPSETSSETSSKLEWAANFSEARVKVSESLGKTTGCGTGPCVGLNHSFGKDIFNQVVQDLDARCGETGCNNLFEVVKGGRKFQVSVAAYYSYSKSTYIDAINEIVKENVEFSVKPDSYSRRPGHNICIKHCSSELNVSTSQKFSFGLYKEKKFNADGIVEEDSGGVHSWFDVEILPVLDVRRDFPICRGVGMAVSQVANRLHAVFGAVVTAVAPITCEALSS